MLIKTSNKLLFFTLLLIFIVCKSYGQNNSEKKSLITVLQSIEQKFEIRFSYATNYLENKNIVPPPDNLTLEQTIHYLNKNTSFAFKTITNRFITVVPKNDKDYFCGRVFDTKTNKPIELANVSVIGKTYTTVTNSEGYFYIPMHLVFKRVIITHIAYENVLFTHAEIEKQDCSNFLMNPIYAILDPVFITNYFTQGIKKQFNGSTFIKTENFGLLPGQIDNDILQIIQVIPGVESIAEKISNINIRGGNNDESLILWDDIRMYQNGHFFGLISAFNPDITKNVSVFKNGTPARFGEGVSGVIDMKSDNALTKKITGGAGFNLINTNLFLKVPLTKSLGIQLSGRRSLNDLLETTVYNSYADRIFQDTKISNIFFSENSSTISSDENFDFFDFSTKILWDFSKKDKLRVNFLTMKNSLDFTETIDETSVSKTSTLKQKNSVGSISWNRFWNHRLNTTTFIYGSFYNLTSTNKDILSTQEVKQKNEVIETGLKLDASLLLTKKATISAGYHFSEVGITNTQNVNLPPVLINEKNVLRTHILFANILYKPFKEKTTINAGVRFNYFLKYLSFIVEPRISIHQDIGKGFAFELLGEFKSQTASQRIDFQSDFLGVEKRRWVLANETDFPIIKSKQISLGLMYNKNKWFINLEAFYKYVAGITTSTQGFQNQFQYIKATGNYNVSGAEFTINKRISNFSTWLSYTLMKNNYTFKNLTPSDFPNNLDVRHSVNIASTYAYKKVKVALGLLWHSGKPYTIPIEDEPIIYNGIENIINYNTPNAERLPDFTRVNFSAEYRWRISDKIESKFNIALLNILNRKNILNTRYSIIPDENGTPQVNKIDEISLGFTPNISFQILF